MLKQDVNIALHHFLRLCMPLALSSSIWAAENALAAPKPNARSWLAAKTLRPSPPTPLPERERGARTPKSALVPLLPLWEKGLGDEGDLFWQPTSARNLAITHAVVQLQGLDVPIPRVKGAATVPLKLLEKSQVYTTPVMVGKLTKPFLIDTGASTTLLSNDLVTTLNLPGRAVSGDRLASAVAGKECASMKATLHELPLLTLGAAEIRGVNGLRFETAAVPDGLAGVMGMDILQQFDLYFNPKAKTLNLSPPTMLPTAVSATAIALQKKLGVFLAKLTLNGQGPFTVLLDTGADSTFISGAIAQRLNLSNRQPAQILGFCGLEPAEKSLLASVKLRQHEQKNLEAIIVSSPILKLLGVDGILGQNFLSQYQQQWRFTPSTINGTKADGSLVLSAP